MRSFGPTPLAAASAVVIAFVTLSALGGCSAIDRLRPGSKASEAKAEQTASLPGQIDVRRYLGPDYCPEVRIFDGAQLMRTYERGHQDDPDYVTWQASFGKTARECLYDAQGNVTIKIGVSGRAVLGPKGNNDAITVPIKIAVIKYKESVLATDRFSPSIAIPQQGSGVFTEVREITVPSPGQNRDYLVYVGFDVGNWDPMKPGDATIAEIAKPQVKEDVPPIAAAPPPPPRKQTPNELPVPSGGFVLGQ